MKSRLADVRTRCKVLRVVSGDLPAVGRTLATLVATLAAPGRVQADAHAAGAGTVVGTMSETGDGLEIGE